VLDGASSWSELSEHPEVGWLSSDKCWLGPAYFSFRRRNRAAGSTGSRAGASARAAAYPWNPSSKNDVEGERRYRIPRPQRRYFRDRLKPGRTGIRFLSGSAVNHLPTLKLITRLRRRLTFLV